MADLTSAVGGIVTPDGGSAPNFPTIFSKLKTSIDGKVVNTFASEAAAKAVGNAAAALDDDFRMVARVTGHQALLSYQGEDDGGWVWVGNSVPVQYINDPGTIGVTGNTGSTTLGYWSNGSYRFTPSRTGWAEVSFISDAAVGATGSPPTVFNQLSLQVRVAKATIAAPTTIGAEVDMERFMILDSLANPTANEWRCKARTLLTAGVDVQFNPWFRTASNGGSWQLRNFRWHIVQQ